MFERVFEVVWEMARQSNLIDLRRPVDVAIDYTDWFFYRNRKTKMVVGRDSEKGLPTCYRFATITIIEPGDRFTLLAIPVPILVSREAILTRLILYAKKRVKIKHLFVDRGFYDAQSIKIIEKFHLNYLMPMVRNPAVKKIMAISPTPMVLTKFPLSKHFVNLIIVEDRNGRKKSEKLVFATNMNFDKREIGLTERLSYLYSKRWGIETSYRVKKHSFLGKTTSKNYSIRLFYFLFSVLLYNLWILADFLIWISLYSSIGEKHLVTSKLFGTMITARDSGG